MIHRSAGLDRNIQLASSRISTSQIQTMIIRPQQIAAFEAVDLRDFKMQVIDHLDEEFPEDCAAIGFDGVLDVVNHGIDRASELGFSEESCVAAFIDLLFILGVYFYEDPEFPWVGAILDDPSLSQEEAISDLILRAQHELDPEGLAEEDKKELPALLVRLAPLEASRRSGR